VNRTDRLYAIVERLRAAASPVSARRLAEHFEVSVRTIERDLLALQESGVPIYAQTGRTGGYVLDASRTLPPVNFTPEEATAIAVALGTRNATPLAQAAGSALAKLLAAMAPEDREAARRLDRRVVRYEPITERPSRVSRLVEQAIVQHLVLRLGYTDKMGAPTERTVEPVAVVGVQPNWYLVAWCRLRGDLRSFRFDRITDATLTRIRAPDRRLPAIEMPGYEIQAGRIE
jgi:predicted DNA-binding transcriptional regulator YafY